MINNADTEVIIDGLRKAAARTQGDEPAKACMLAAANRLETMKQTATRFEWMQTKAVRALMAMESPSGGPTCPMEFDYLDEERMYVEDRLDFRCVHRKFDGQCPFEKKDEGATESDIYLCWLAWLDGREIG
ncbi:MAG: hypothetical protein M0P69_12005 [Bacteroidales bacterium]|nr:hypothetical protein [Bacteroidales bacterium]